MTTNRRKFITTSSLSLLGLSLFSSTPVKAISFSNHLAPNQTITQLLRQAALKRKNGDYVQATNLYNQIVTLDASEVRAYDGLRKILLQGKYKELEVLQLYSNGLIQNPGSLIFRERVAKEYMRLALGNKKFVNQLNSPEDLLTLSKSIFKQLKDDNSSSNIQFQEQFKKAKRKENQNASVLDARVNLDLKNYKKNNRKDFKKRFKDLDEATIENKLNSLLIKPLSLQRKKHIKELYKILIRKHKKSNNINQAVLKLNELYQYDQSDVNSLRLARKICKKHSKFSALESIERQNDTFKNSFWSKIALSDVLIKRFKKENVGNPTEIRNILNSAQNLIFNPSHYFEVDSRKLKFAIITGNQLESKNQLLLFGKSINGISSSHFINRFNLLCVKYFKKFNNDKNALATIGIALNETNKEPEEEILKLIYYVNAGKNDLKPIHNQRLNEVKLKLMSNQLD